MDSLQFSQFLFKGKSMWPFLKEGDFLLVEEAKSSIEVGDIILFRSSKEFICHRVISLKPLITKGDRRYQGEEISRDMIVGKISGLKRKEKSFFWENNFGHRLISRVSSLMLSNSLMRYFYFFFNALLGQAFRIIYSLASKSHKLESS